MTVTSLGAIRPPGDNEGIMFSRKVSEMQWHSHAIDIGYPLMMVRDIKHGLVLCGSVRLTNELLASKVCKALCMTSP